MIGIEKILDCDRYPDTRYMVWYLPGGVCGRGPRNYEIICGLWCISSHKFIGKPLRRRAVSNSDLGERVKILACKSA
jgi:hypothetical protein